MQSQGFREIASYRHNDNCLTGFYITPPRRGRIDNLCVITDFIFDFWRYLIDMLGFIDFIFDFWRYLIDMLGFIASTQPT